MAEVGRVADGSHVRYDTVNWFIDGKCRRALLSGTTR